MNDNKKAFTLTELLVSIVIILLISGIGLSFYQGGQDKRELRNAARELAQDIRRVQNFSSATRAENADGRGYGIRIERQNDRYFLFYNKGTAGDDEKKYDIDDAILKEIELPSNIDFLHAYVDGTDTHNTSIVIWPDLSTFIYNKDDDTWGSESDIVICLKLKSNIQSSIIFNKKGRVKTEFSIQ